MTQDRVDAWVGDLLTHHAGSFRRSELLKAIRALSARYVERRSTLGRRSPTDSSGRRAAFAVYYAPLHFLTIGEVHRALGRPAPSSSVADLGCGTGVAGAAWVLASAADGATIDAVDRDGWAVAEARRTLRALGLRGSVRRTDLVRAASQLATADRRRPTAVTRTVVAAWSINEIAPAERHSLLTALQQLMRRGTSVLVVEPLADAAAPWWSEWAGTVHALGGRHDEWRFATPLPPTLAELHRQAGFRRGPLAARTLFHPGAA